MNTQGFLFDLVQHALGNGAALALAKPDGTLVLVNDFDHFVTLGKQIDTGDLAFHDLIPATPW